MSPMLPASDAQKPQTGVSQPFGACPTRVKNLCILENIIEIIFCVWGAIINSLSFLILSVFYVYSKKSGEIQKFLIVWDGRGLFKNSDIFDVFKA